MPGTTDSVVDLRDVEVHFQLDEGLPPLRALHEAMRWRTQTSAVAA